MSRSTVNMTEFLESIRDCLVDGELSLATELRSEVQDAILEGETWLTSEEELLITSF
jgi:hypothetical protein